VNLSFTPQRSPFRLDLDRTDFAHRVVAEAAPRPIFGPRYQSSDNRVPVDVLQLLDTLAPGAHIEVVKTALPELPGGFVGKVFEFCGCAILFPLLEKGGIENPPRLMRHPLFEDLKGPFPDLRLSGLRSAGESARA